MNTKTTVYDLPTRLFHWLFAMLFCSAFLIAKTMDDDSPIYPYHMMLGMILVFSVILRIFWGLIGSRYARFSSFQLRPSQLWRYAKQLVTQETDRELGHNPASSWSALLMMALAFGLGLTGFLMTTGQNKDLFKEVHEWIAHIFLVVVIAHVCGVIIHVLRHRDAMALSMIHGKKQSIEGQRGIDRAHLGAALCFLLLILIFSFNLNRNYSPVTKKIHLLGWQLSLGELENHNNEDGDED